MKIFYRREAWSIEERDHFTEWKEITDLYFFEEQGIHSFQDGEGLHGEKYEFKYIAEDGDNLSITIKWRIHNG